MTKNSDAENRRPKKSKSLSARTIRYTVLGCVLFGLIAELIGVREGSRGLNEGCRHCHFDNCADCAEKGGVCVYDPMDLGIAIGSAVAAAADDRVDNRVLFSAGRAAMSLGLMGEDARMVMGIPLSVRGKNPFFDRK